MSKLPYYLVNYFDKFIFPHKLPFLFTVVVVAVVVAAARPDGEDRELAGERVDADVGHVLLLLVLAADPVEHVLLADLVVLGTRVGGGGSPGEK